MKKIKESYINKNFSLPKQTFLDLENEFLSHDTKQKHFFYHILSNPVIRKDKGSPNSEFTNFHDSVWVPVPSTLIEKHFGRSFKVTDLECRGYLEIKKLNDDGNTYSHAGNICRSYRLPKKIYSIFIRSLEQNKESDEWVNAFSGRPKKKSKSNADFIALKSIPSNNIVRKAMNSIKRTIFNHVQVKHLLDKMKEEARYSEKAKRRYMIDLYSMAIVFAKSQEISEELSEYTGHMVKLQKSGRITEIGGFQSCSREMKHAAFAGISDVHNYDLKSSQVLGLLQLFEEAGISTVELEGILSDDKREVSECMNLEVDSYKAALMSIIMGASLKPPTSENLETSGAVYTYISQGTTTTALDSYTRFYDKFSPLKKDINKWHTHLVNNALSTMNRQKRISNKCNIKLDLKEFLESDGEISRMGKLKRTLAAYYLQGQEANYIHTLCTLSTKYGFEVYSNQHDGLVTRGVIPVEASKEAARLSGFKYALLEEKNFVEGKDLNEPVDTRPKEELSGSIHINYKANPPRNFTEVSIPTTTVYAKAPTTGRKRRRRKPPDDLPTEWQYEEFTPEALAVLFG